MEGQDNDISRESTLQTEEEVSCTLQKGCSEMSGESLSSTRVAKKLMELEAERNKVRRDILSYQKCLAEGEQKVALKTKQIEDLDKTKLVLEEREEFYALTLNFISSGSSPESVKIKFLGDLTKVLKTFSSNKTKEQLKETMRAVEEIFVNYLESESAYDTESTTSADPSCEPVEENPAKILQPTKKSRPIMPIQNEDEIFDNGQVVGTSAPSTHSTQGNGEFLDGYKSKDIGKEEVNNQNSVAAHNLIQSLQPLLAPGGIGVNQMKEFAILFQTLFEQRKDSPKRQKDIDTFCGFIKDRLNEREDFEANKLADEENANQPEPGSSNRKRPAESEATDLQKEKVAKMDKNA